ncbi:MAG: beta-lactamase class A-like protein beta-lactamase [Candidatus Parcubacteria bacterium]|nr:beta-lactamase class A-like protein beta-lactamase [Candidatus Parcubacteria bacterium]
MKNTWTLSIAAGCILLIGATVGWAAKEYVSDPAAPLAVPAGSGQIRANLPQYKFINPLLFSDNSKSADPRFQMLSASLKSYISSVKQSDSVDSVSVYFRDLNTGRWTGVDENDLYTPSSMLKVVVMMAALKLAEQNPSILSEKFLYKKTDYSTGNHFNSEDPIATGYYSLQDMVGFMIKYSDNDAFNALVADKRINSEFTQVYSLFKLPEAGLMGSTTDFMSPKSFSTVFRTLYNSSFFEWNLSEQVLNLLSQTTFKQGLVGGVPGSVVVAHKFGENTDELHDCGVVYYPNDPYLLCVMTRGTNADALGAVIGKVSKIVWDFVGQGGVSQN